MPSANRAAGRAHTPVVGNVRSSTLRDRQLRIHSTRLHVVLYALLLIATPFLLLQNFLVELIGAVSTYHTTVGGLRLPVVPVIAGTIALGLVVWFRQRIRRRHLVAAAVVVLMDAAAQQVTDYYFAHNFYDLQQNWHYIAYGLFGFFLYRDLRPRGTPLARIILLTAGIALGLSSFDELFQMRMSRRVFDIGDISKDLWGTLMGMVLIYVGGPGLDELRRAGWRLRHARARDYLQQPLALLAWLIIWGFVFVCISALLTEVEYLWVAVTLTVGICVALFLIVHASQFRRVRYVLVTLAVAAAGTQAYFAYRYRGTGITYAARNLTVYAGVPLPVFDWLFFADGSFRPVDKKHLFNNRDQRTLLLHRPDILVIGAGFEGRGGHGFPEKSPCFFIYNPFLGRGTQVVILPTPQACELFNRLRREHRNALFVLHSGC